jgi:hypothetical protein
MNIRNPLTKENVNLNPRKYDLLFLKKKIFWAFIFLKYTQWQLSHDNSTAMYKFLKKPYTLAGFEPGIFCSVGGEIRLATLTFPSFRMTVPNPIILEAKKCWSLFCAYGHKYKNLHTFHSKCQYFKNIFAKTIGDFDSNYSPSSRDNIATLICLKIVNLGRTLEKIVEINDHNIALQENRHFLHKIVEKRRKQCL